MADIKISALPGASTLTGAETIPLVQGGTTKKVTTDQFLIKDASGNVGIGTASPSSKLDVRGQLEAGNGTIRGGVSYSTQALVGSLSNHNLGFITNGTTQATLDTSGNLGLGVTPSAWAGVTGTMQMPDGGIFGFAGASGDFVANAYYNGGYKYVKTAAATVYAQTAGAHTWFTAPSGTAGNAISFTQVMTLDASGNLLVGTASARGVGATIYNPGSGVGRIDINKSSSGTAIGFGFYYNGADVGSISYDNTSTSFNTSSDARLKENISNADNGSALIDSLQVRKFDWKSDGSHQRFGFVAQELDAVYPEAVSKPADPDEMMGVDYSKLVPLLVQEIQSLRARVAALETV